MLGRIGSGSTVAALPWAAAIVAATEGRLLLASLFGGLTLGIMFFALAPWIPKVRDLLPSYQRVKMLESFWEEGHELAYERLASEAEFKAWQERRADWVKRTATWIDDQISPVEARRFFQPQVPDHHVSDSLHADHARMRNFITYQLPELVRLRDAVDPRTGSPPK